MNFNLLTIFVCTGFVASVYAQASQYVECYTCSGVDTDANNPCPEIGFDPVKLNATMFNAHRQELHALNLRKSSQG
ncbi:hypothetical protein EB796_019995 [Bugula neritina]|uniref:Uncharacterized protein n=1 Tax=Bugula neritina TaxID=10212 RepID=A0A7J7J6Z2_BUGNE|nr:hypothetical protein EB796_019995 [Bugula neritina]